MRAQSSKAIKEQGRMDIVQAGMQPLALQQATFWIDWLSR